jgi:Ca2+-binding EF-hand superfamily protein
MIFDQYATDEQMNKAQCHEFTVKCLGSSSSPKFYENKINELFKEYDQNQDDLLTFEDFLNFYKNAAINRPSTVWSNLKSFGVEGNFKFSYEADG